MIRQTLALILLFLALVQGAAGFGQDLLSPPLPFKAWREQQLMEARNQVVRVTNKMTLDRSQPVPLQTSVEANPSKGLKGSKPETELKRALDNLQSAKELTIEDYFLVYLSRYKGQPQALEFIAQRLTREEIAELLKVMLNSSSVESLKSAPHPAVGLVANDKSR